MTESWKRGGGGELVRERERERDRERERQRELLTAPLQSSLMVPSGVRRMTDIRLRVLYLEKQTNIN